MDVYYKIPLYHAKASLAPIRLLRLHPAQHLDDLIQCDLFLSDLDGPDSFEALSYTWGSVDNPAKISLQGGPRHVTQNLATALRYLRLPDRTRVLWVDALCINQADDVEKSHQVKQMRRVYTSSYTERVLVWLGGEETARTAFDFLGRLEKANETAEENARKTKAFFPGKNDAALTDVLMELQQRIDGSGMTMKDFAESVASPAERAFLKHLEQSSRPLEEEDPLTPLLHGHDSEWNSCRDLFNRPWWHRTWILQEVMHARDVMVHIGALDSMPIDKICRAARLYQNFLNIRLPIFRDLETRPPPGVFNFEVWLRVAGTVESPASNIRAMRDKYSEMGKAATARLSDLLYQLRKQQATDPRDKIYGLLGMSTNEYGIDPDYCMSKGILYTLVARHMLAKALFAVLLWVESPDRDITSEGLPSWVVDHTTRQSYGAMAMAQQWRLFSANKGFPASDLKGSEEPHLMQSLKARTLVVRGIRIGTMTEVRDARITADKKLEGEDSIRLLGYKSAGQSYSIDKEDGIKGSFRNSSWGPCKAAVGDIIIIVAGSTVPLVIRQADEEEEYLFVGGCWLIDSEIRDLSNVRNEPGFSPMMFGSACVGVEVAQIELFHIR